MGESLNRIKREVGQLLGGEDHVKLCYAGSLFQVKGA